MHRSGEGDVWRETRRVLMKRGLERERPGEGNVWTGRGMEREGFG